MKTNTSTTNIGGTATQVKHTLPNAEEWMKKHGTMPEGMDGEVAKAILGHPGIVRAIGIANDYLNRHHFLPDCRGAGDIIENGSACKTDKAKEKEQAWAVAMLEKIEQGHVFDLLDFLPAQRGESVAEHLKPFMKVAREHYDGYVANGMGDRVAEKFGAFTVEAIAGALYERSKKADILGL
jgi:hypothetical protein